MNPIFFLAVAGLERLVIPGIIVFFALAFIINVLAFAKRYQKVGPDEVLIISGRSHKFIDRQGVPRTAGFRMVRGGGVIVLPFVEKASRLSLKPISFDLSLQNVPARASSTLNFAAKVQVQIRPDNESILKAAQAFLSSSEAEIKSSLFEIMEGVARPAIGSRNAEDICRDPNRLAQVLQDDASPRLAELGVKILSLSVTETRVEMSGA